MSRYLVHHDGLFLGSSSACNLVACIRLTKKMGWSKKQKIVTILWVPHRMTSDSGVLKSLADVTRVADITPSSGMTSECISPIFTHRYCRNDDYLAKANIPIDMGIIDRMLSETS